jgi:hypothetical protein
MGYTLDVMDKMIRSLQTHWAPIPVRSLPRDLSYTPEVVRDIIKRHHAGGKVEPHEEAEVRAYNGWMLSVTCAEAENTGRLQALMGAVRYMRDETRRIHSEANVDRGRMLANWIRETWHVDRVPDTALECRELAQQACKRLDAMPEQWRHMGGV